MSKLMRTVGVVSFVLAATLTVGASGAMVSRNCDWAAAIPLRLLAWLMALTASARVLWASVETVTPELLTIELRVLESVRLTGVFDEVIWLATALMTLAPAVVSPSATSSAIATICAAAFCAASACA